MEKGVEGDAVVVGIEVYEVVEVVEVVEVLGNLAGIVVVVVVVVGNEAVLGRPPC